MNLVIQSGNKMFPWWFPFISQGAFVSSDSTSPIKYLGKPIFWRNKMMDIMFEYFASNKQHNNNNNNNNSSSSSNNNNNNNNNKNKKQTTNNYNYNSHIIIIQQKTLSEFHARFPKQTNRRRFVGLLSDTAFRHGLDLGIWPTGFDHMVPRVRR